MLRSSSDVGPAFDGGWRHVRQNGEVPDVETSPTQPFPGHQDAVRNEGTRAELAKGFW